jgi:hypothetical protein
MKTISMTARSGGEQIRLDEPLEPDAKSLVTVLPGSGREAAVWRHLSRRGLADAYGEDEEEYTLEDLRIRLPRV